MSARDLVAATDARFCLAQTGAEAIREVLEGILRQKRGPPEGVPVGTEPDDALDPLALAIGGTGKTLDAVGARLQITPIVGVGLDSGAGIALGGNINLPTGDPLAFTNDGAISGGVSVIADYRFNFGLIIASTSSPPIAGRGTA